MFGASLLVMSLNALLFCRVRNLAYDVEFNIITIYSSNLESVDA